MGSLKHKHKESSVDETPRKRHKSSSRKTVDCSDESDSKQNFHRDDPQIGVCLQYLRSYDEEEVTSGKNENGKLDKHTSSIEDLRLNGSMWELVRKYIRCSSRTTIGHINKYLKLKLKLSAVDQVSLAEISHTSLDRGGKGIFLKAWVAYSIFPEMCESCFQSWNVISSKAVSSDEEKKKSVKWELSS